LLTYRLRGSHSGVPSHPSRTVPIIHPGTPGRVAPAIPWCRRFLDVPHSGRPIWHYPLRLAFRNLSCPKVGIVQELLWGRKPGGCRGNQLPSARRSFCAHRTGRAEASPPGR
jgi:hypothetical protein